jgi:polysaccharide biosynthesis transport protein
MAVSSLSKQIAQVGGYWAVVAKYKWQCLIGALLLTLSFAIIIWKLPNVYEATTTILVDPQQVPEKYVSAVASPDSYARLNTLTQQVLSRSRLQEVIEKYNLYADHRKPLSPEERVEEMRRDITIEVKQGSEMELSTFSLTYQGKLPVLVAAVANELADSFIQWNIQSRLEQVSGTKDFLSAELTTAKRNLERQEDALRQFKMNHLGETPDQTPNNLVAIAGLRAGLQANVETMNRLDEEKILLTHSVEPASSGTIPRAATERETLEAEKRQTEASIEQLRAHYSDRYPDVIRATRKLDEIKSRLNSLPSDPTPGTSDASAEKSDVGVRLAIIDQEMRKLEADRDRMQAQLDSYQNKVDAAPLREQELLELSRNYDTSKQHYQALLDKSFNIAMAADLEQNQKAERFRVLDPARVPQKPVKPARIKLIAASGFLAFGLSILIVLLKEELNPVVKTEIELKSLLPSSVRIWSFVPRIDVASDTLRARRWTIGASVICILLCVAILGVIQQIHPF